MTISTAEQNINYSAKTPAFPFHDLRAEGSSLMYLICNMVNSGLQYFVTINSGGLHRGTSLVVVRTGLVPSPYLCNLTLKCLPDIAFHKASNLLSTGLLAWNSQFMGWTNIKR